MEVKIGEKYRLNRSKMSTVELQAALRGCYKNIVTIDYIGTSIVRIRESAWWVSSIDLLPLHRILKYNRGSCEI